MSNIDATLAERGNRYGEFVDHADITQNIKNAMSLGCNWTLLNNDMREALEMVAHKIGRILNGDPNYVDSWTDIIGYTRLVEKRLIGAEQAVVKEMLEKQPPQAAKKSCDCPACQIEAVLRKALKPAS
ncbi:MAG: hypothetical protein HQ445_09120 [Polaromonas sp.]|nr:hypothetical protein [Polaromonas sp.]